MSNDPPLEKPTTKTSYPKAEVGYQEIAANPVFFLEKLEAFHSFYGSKFRVPKLGGHALNLHQLFVEVTSRGGIEKVIRERRWKEVTAAFNFPSSITSASFVLRKYYMTLLYHFEQVYYFRKEAPAISASDHSTRISNGSRASDAQENGATLNKHPVSFNLEQGSLVTGTIEAKFDSAYLITVNVGSEKLSGVLYHTSLVSDSLQNSTPLAEPGQRSRKRHQPSSRDPAHPKPNRSGYTFFFAEHYAKLRPMYHGQERTISKKIGDLWSRLTEAEKQVYQEKALQDKERYKAEMLEYRSSQNS